MHKIILIGGAPTAGKSYVARKIADELSLPWISTDTIRELMRETVRPEDYPHLFDHAEAAGKDAVAYLNQNTAAEIVENHIKENEDVWKGIHALLKTDYVWGSFIVEGVAIVPHLASSLTGRNKRIISLFLIEEREERIREVVYTRGLWDEAHKYPDSVKEKEVEWVMEYNTWIKKEAEKHGFPVINVGDRSSYLEEIKKLVSN